MTQIAIQGFHEPVQPLAAHPGHPLIADDHIIIFRFDLLQRFHGRVGQVDSSSLPSQDIEDKLGNVNLVVDHQNLLAAQRQTFRHSNGLDCFRRDFALDGQLQSKGRTAAVGAPGVQFTTMLFHDLGTNAEPKAGTVLSIFSGKERSEYTRHVAGMDAAAVVGHA